MSVCAKGTFHTLGGPEDAPLVASIRGPGLSRDGTWKRITPTSARSLQVLNYDPCGHGEPALPDGQPSLTVFSEQQIMLIDGPGIPRTVLVGVSLDGMINYHRAAVDYSDRVSVLAIINPPHERCPEQPQLVEVRAWDTAAGGPAANIDVTRCSIGLRRNR